MQFSQESDITLVVTSCGRLDLLKLTLESFDRFNSAPIREVFITEDAGDERVRTAVPAHWKDHCTFFVNRPKLGQLASIDLAYEQVKTPISSIAKTIGSSTARVLSRIRKRFSSSARTSCRSGCAVMPMTCESIVLTSTWVPAS